MRPEYVEMREALEGLHAAQAAVNAAALDHLVSLAEQNYRLFEENRKLREEAEYCRYQLDIRGIVPEPGRNLWVCRACRGDDLVCAIPAPCPPEQCPLGKDYLMEWYLLASPPAPPPSP